MHNRSAEPQRACGYKLTLVTTWSIPLHCPKPCVGIGFAKTDAGNVELMAGLGQLRARLNGLLGRLPLLVGPSRKGFIGRLTGERWRCRPSAVTNESQVD
jgi:hypothetical protein